MTGYARKEDAQGVRTYFLYDGSQLVGEFDQNGAAQATQTWGAEGLAYRRQLTGAAAGTKFYWATVTTDCLLIPPFIGRRLKLRPFWRALRHLRSGGASKAHLPMKTTWLPLSLKMARAALRPLPLCLPVLGVVSVVRAQDAPTILFPKANQDVRGEISARFEGIAARGYVIVKLAKQGEAPQFKTATAQGNFTLDTIADTATFNGDGLYTLEITALNASGRATGTSSVTFNVANQKVAGNSEATRLVHWTPADRVAESVQRYRIFAESNADITAPSTGAGGGAGGGGFGGAGGGGAPAGRGGGGDTGGGGTGTSVPAPLDWQVSVLLRRQLRDAYGFDKAANVATVVAEAWQHQRMDSSGGAGGPGGANQSAAPTRRKGAVPTGAPSASGKAPWNPTWVEGPELAKFYIKTIQQTGDDIYEVNQVHTRRKPNSVALADLLPTFPTVSVRPGSTWNSRQTIISDLSTRTPINIEGAVTFTSYDTIQTPAGDSRRCAKIESRFPLPDQIAKRIAADIGNKVGKGGGAGGGLTGGSGAPTTAPGAGGGGVGGAGGAADTGLQPEDIDVAQFNMARVIWFDMDKHQVVRSEDTLQAYFEIPSATTGADASGAGGGGFGGPGGGGSGPGAGFGGAPAAPAEPTKVKYSMNVTTWLDDRRPDPTVKYNGGAGTAHSRDNVNEVGLSRLTKR